MTKYNPKKIHSSLKLIDKAIEQSKKSNKLMHEMKRSMIRIQRALKPKFWLHDELEKEKQKLLKELPAGKTSYGFQSITRHAKINIINREKYLLSFIRENNIPWDRHQMNGMKWDDFKFYLEKQYENDRKLIKEGKL